MSTDPKAIAVAMAIKQSIETSSEPGLGVNAHPNAFYLHVNGPLNLYRAAEHALARIAQYEEAAERAALKEAAAAAPPLISP